MNIIDYIKDVVIPDCGVSPFYIDVVRLIFNAELETKLFDQDRITNTRERASMLLPFKPKKWFKYNHFLDVIEYGICLHRKEKHKERKYNDRIKKIRKKLSNDEQIMVRSWWNS